MTDRWLSAWGLAAVAFGGASLVVPLYVVALGGGPVTLGVLFASASFVGVPGALVFGRLADRTGRRRGFVLGAMATATGAMAAIPLVDGIPAVVVANALLWLGFAAATPVLTLLVVADEPEQAWSARIARLNRSQGIGWALGLGLGTAVVVAGTTVTDPLTAQRGVFLACALAAGAGLALGARHLPPDGDPDAAPSPKRLRRRLRPSIRFDVRGAGFPVAPGRIDVRRLHPRRFLDRFTPRLAVHFLSVLLVFTGFGVFFAPLPAYLAGAGYGDGEIFALYLLLNAAAAAFYAPAARFAVATDVVRVHIGGLLARGVTFPALPVAVTALAGTALAPGVVAVGFLVVGLSWAVVAVTTATLVTALAPAAIRGEALGAYAALAALGGGVGGLLGGWVATVGYTVTFAVAGGLVVCGAVVASRLPAIGTGLDAGAGAPPSAVDAPDD